jgi:acyl-CoA thioesterase
MTQEGRPVLHAMVKTVAEGPGHIDRHLQMPDVASPEQLQNYEQLLTAERRPPFNFWDNIERRPIDQVRPPQPAEPVLREWARYRPTARFDDPFVDASRALILLDTYGFPAAWRRFRSMEYLAPNLDTSAWFHHFSPACEWLLVDHACTVAGDGLMAVDGKIWDTDGRLLATGAAQLYCIPNPRGGE